MNLEGFAESLRLPEEFLLLGRIGGRQIKMLNAVARIMLTLTALAPVGFTYAWVAFLEGKAESGILIVFGSLSLVFVCVAILLSARDRLTSLDFEAASLEAADHENTAFLILYIMPLLTSQFSNLEWHFWVPTILIFAVITATGYSYHFNPLLGLMGWHFYKVQSKEGVTFVVITRKHLRTPTQKLNVGQLTEYILIDLGDS